MLFSVYMFIDLPVRFHKQRNQPERNDRMD